MTSDRPPQTIGRYEIREELGRGGMATVYRAFDPQVHREVAVKLLPRQFTHDSSFRGRFAREAKIVAALDHPAIVPVLDYGEEGDQPYLVMRLMAGGTLTDRLEAGPMPLTDIGRILNRVAPALDAAHSRGAIHRDLKPSNILFDQWGEPYLADFGIVKLTESTIATVSQYSLGTPAYMSPEQIEGKTELDGRSDVYALGVILFEMLSGKRPYEATTPMGLMMQHVNEPIPDIRGRLADLPPDSQLIINKAMAKRREDRYPTATSLATDVAYLAGLPAPTPLPISTQTPLAEPPRTPMTPRPQPTPAPISPTPIDPTQVMAPQKTVTGPPVSQPAAAPRKLPLWVFGIGGMGLLVVLAVIIAGVALLLNNQNGGNEDNAAANNTGNNESVTTENDGSSNNSNATDDSGNDDSDESVSDEPTLEPTPEIPQAAFPVWTLDDVESAFPLTASGFPLPAERLPILPENSTDLIPLAQYGRGTIRDIDYSADGQWIAAAAEEGIYLYQASDLALVWYQEAQDSNVAFHPEGQTLAVADEGDIQLWSVATGELQLTLIDNNQYTGYLLTYSPDGQYVVATNSNNAIQIWSAEGILLQELSDNENRLSDLTFSPDSTQITATSQDTITIWDIESGSISQTLTRAETSFEEVIYLTATTLVAAASQSGIFFWEATDGAFPAEPTQFIAETIPTTGFIAATPDGLMATGIWNTVYLWWAGETEPFYILPSIGGSTIHLAFSPDGTTLLVGSENYVARWRIDGDTPEPIDFLVPHIGAPFDVAFAPDGETIAATSSNGVCIVWESNTGALRFALTNPPQEPSAVMYTPDGDLAVGSFSSATQLWLGDSGQLRFATENEGDFHYILDVAVSADNGWIAAALSEGGITILDRETGEIQQTLAGHTGNVNALTFLPRTDITLLASGGEDGLVNLWQYDGEEFVLLTTYQDAPISINALASDGAYLAAGDDDGTIWFYYLETTDDAANAASGSFAVNEGVASMAYSPDGQLLAASTFNGEVEIIHLAEIRTIQILPWGGTVAFSPDGTLLAAASSAGMRVWAVRP